MSPETLARIKECGTKIRRLQFDSSRPAIVKEFLECCPDLTDLTIYSCAFGDQFVQELARLPHAQALTHLELCSNRITSVGAEALAKSYLPNLRSLNLSNNQIEDAGAEAIASSTHMRNLTYLALQSNWITEIGAQALADSSTLSGLVELNLDDNWVRDEGGQALVVSTTLQGLTSLHLQKNRMINEKRELKSLCRSNLQLKL